MYPFPVVLIDLDEEIFPKVRWELDNAKVEVEREFSSARVAIEFLRQTKSQPRLIIIQLSQECETTTIQRLSDSLAGWPILALIPGANSLHDYLQVNRAGATQLVPLPLDPDDFRRALKRIEPQAVSGSQVRHVFAVTGATGGSGVTTIGINLASEIADQLRRTTILAELTLKMGELAGMLNIEPRVTLPYLIREIDRVDDLLLEKSLVPVADGLRILAGSEEVGSLHSVDPAHLLKIVTGLKALAEVVVLDVPATFDDTQFEVLNASDQMLLVGLQNVPSIRALKLIYESLPEERLIASVWVLINRYNPELKGFTRPEIQQILGATRVLTIANDFHAVNRAVNHGRPLRQVAPNSPILRDLDGVMHALLGLGPHHSSKRGLLGRVLNAFTR